MNNLYKSQNLFSTPYKEIYNLLNGKSKYLRTLEKKKEDSYKLINDQRIGIIKERLIRTNRFNRDYAIFSKPKLFIKQKSDRLKKFHFTPDLKLLILSPEEANDPYRYKKKQYDIDPFSLIYKETNSYNLPGSKPLKMSFNRTKFSNIDKKKLNKTSLINCFLDLEEKKSYEFHNKINLNNSPNISNKSNISKNNSPFLTLVANNIILNKSIKSK